MSLQHVANGLYVHKKDSRTLLYVLPTLTAKGREILHSVRSDGRTISAKGIFVSKIMQPLGESAQAKFGCAADPKLGINEARDYVAVHFSSTDELTKKRQMIEEKLLEFLDRVRTHPQTSLFRPAFPKGAALDQEILVAAQFYADRGEGNQGIAAIKGVVSIFNTYVANPDGGEIKYAGYTDNVAKVTLHGGCSDCGETSATVMLMRTLLTGKLPDVVKNVQTVSVP